MILVNYPERKTWDKLLTRPVLNTVHLNEMVKGILDQVKYNGDEAVFSYEETYDHVRLASLQVTEDEIQEAETLVSDDLKNAIILAKSNITKFHEAQRFAGVQVQTQPGVTCWQQSIAIERVGLYIPGGTAPLFSTVLMLAIPAKIAGCREIVLCTPPSRNGKVHPAVLFAAKTAGVNHIFKIGGVQAIGAMAYGTNTVPRVYKIFGPGNQYVTAAKQVVSLGDVAIDMPAGPSEVMVLADETANPEFIAADLLSQAEHGVDSQAMLITTSVSLQQAVMKEVELQLTRLTRKDIASKSLKNSRLILVKDMDEAIEMTNEYAPEHLIIQTRNYNEVAKRIVNAGSIFLGEYACESAGDYASGTNHTLPTNGYAKAYNGVNLDSFCRKITYQELTAQGIGNIGKAIEVMASNEQLDAHKNAVTVRLQSRKFGVESITCNAIQSSFSLEKLVRKNIWNLAPYSCARDEYSGVEASVFLDANENPYNAPINRYPDPLQKELKHEIAKVKGVREDCIFCGNGSDEAIDLLYRVFCNPGVDNVVAIDPSYGMYKVCADVNDVEYRKVSLNEEFQFAAKDMLALADYHTKLMFLCSPNNPTGNDMNHKEVEALLQAFSGIVVVDEAYFDFSDQPSFTKWLDKYPNLIVLQTLSKAWGCAAIRLGMAFASQEIIGLFNKVKYPYNVNMLTQQQALEALRNFQQTKEWVTILKEERTRLMRLFALLPLTEKVFPSDANFFLARVTDANAIYRYLVTEGIIVRNRHTVTLCNNCLRITIGTPEENNTLIKALKAYGEGRTV
ncbi:MAG: histidinol dehydrogenase [Bacteroidaceae bacterium]|nr:histidinol dehydrogenase [Bacteroidaceae bacterium]